MIILIFPQFLHRDAFSSKRIHRVLFKKLAWNKIWERLGAWVWSHRLSISKTSSAWKEGEERHSLLFSHGEEFQGVDFNQDPINRGASFYRHTESERWMENFATYRLKPAQDTSKWGIVISTAMHRMQWDVAKPCNFDFVLALIALSALDMQQEVDNDDLCCEITMEVKFTTIVSKLINGSMMTTSSVEWNPDGPCDSILGRLWYNLHRWQQGRYLSLVWLYFWSLLLHPTKDFQGNCGVTTNDSARLVLENYSWFGASKEGYGHEAVSCQRHIWRNGAEISPFGLGVIIILLGISDNSITM